MKLSSLFTLPTILTLFRLVFSSFLLPIMLITFIPYNNVSINSCLAIIFSLVSLTDFLDGFLARKLGQESELGKVLDPIADKFLLYSSLIALLVVHRIYYYWVILLIGREFFIMGLRLVALENEFEIPVSKFGKVKTTVQFFYLTILILNPVLLNNTYATFFMVTEMMLLGLALILSVGSAYYYYCNFMDAIWLRMYEGDFK